ncbi:MAG TPA: patatin-like phospholipase family protein, partial [Pirellulales bacterium]|nr:patatin-like phospholipase family protein [Pirellulales bacterium]
WLLDVATPVAPYVAGLPWRHRPFCVPMASDGGPPDRLERQGLDRLVRSLRGVSLGIALAGGGAKGMAHLGVLRVLEEAGLSFDAMSGTSAGAMAGITYAAGMPPADAVEHFQHDLLPSALFRLVPKWPNWYLLSQFRRHAWEAMLRRYLHDWRLEQLPIPFYSVAVDLVQVRPVVRDHGDAVRAILESINLPVLSAPILRDGMVLVDGGILNNLPADVLVDHDVDFVIGVDVSRRVRHEFAGNRPETPTHEMKSPSTLDTMFRIFETQAHSIGNIRNRAVDFWITPDTSSFGLAEFYRTTEIAEAGARAAEAKLPELQQHLDELKHRLLGSVSTTSARR